MIVLALAAIAILGTVLLTRGKHTEGLARRPGAPAPSRTSTPRCRSGDLTALRSITCGTTRDGYVDYDEHAWTETYQRVAAAKQYPVVASIDQVVVNGQHAEANVTTFMAYDPQVRSTRSLDLQFRDDQWKICQSPSGYDVSVRPSQCRAPPIALASAGSRRRPTFRRSAGRCRPR